MKAGRIERYTVRYVHFPLMFTIKQQWSGHMNTQPIGNGTFNVPANQKLMLEGETPDSLKLLLQGKIEAYISPAGMQQRSSDPDDAVRAGYRLFDLDRNIFIGAGELFAGRQSLLTYVAASDCCLCSFPAQNTQDVVELVTKHKEYGAYIIDSISDLILNAYQALDSALSYCNTLYGIYSNLCAYYVSLCSKHGFPGIPGSISATGGHTASRLIEKGSAIPSAFSRQFVEAPETGGPALTPENSGLDEQVRYYRQLNNISPNIRKLFFASDIYVTGKHAEEAAKCLVSIVDGLRRVFRHLEDTIGLLYGTEGNDAYNAFIQAAFRMKEMGLDHAPALDAASYIYDKLKEISSHIASVYKHDTGIDFGYLDHVHSDRTAVLSSIAADETGITVSSGTILSLPEELQNSAARILEYAEIPEDKATFFLMNMTAFRNLRDRTSSDESARAVRKAVADMFFDIYAAVFRKAVRTKDDSRLVRMFLSYGYMDEKLLDPGQTMAIYRLAGMNHVSDGTANVYFLHEWLTEIYNMTRDPSVDSFGNDYADTFRELKRQGRLTDNDKAAYMSNREDRLDFEINNMVKTNHKLVQGKISEYFPILHRDAAPYDPCRSFVSPSLICEKLNRILEIDFSLFHREINYINAEKGIEKELVMKKVMPDIVIMPVYGTRAMMWQEIAGRVRSSPGRFIVPVFTDENLEDMMVRLAGNFRWELCRTMMGPAWNDITQSSLTSEYADYIQFYRKNRDLTEEAKEKVKALITKHNNRLREIFTAEYEIWINNESNGNPRLNRVARSIFMKYCPFSRPIREYLAKQPIYSDLLQQFSIQRARKAKELENRYRTYIRAHGSLDPVLQENLDFYSLL